MDIGLIDIRDAADGSHSRSVGLGSSVLISYRELTCAPSTLGPISRPRAQPAEYDAVAWRARAGLGGAAFNEGSRMNTVKLAAIALIAAGVLGLVYGGFSYTKETHEAKLGSIELSVKDRETINIPMWAGIGAIVIGGALLLVGGKKS